MTRLPPKKSPVRRAKRPASESSAPLIMSQEEKHQLILAHAARRRPLDPVQRVSLWAGVIICLLFVVGAWAYTFGSGIRRSMAGPMDQNLKGALEQIRSISQPSPADDNELAEKLQEVSARLDTLSRQKAVDELLKQIAPTSSENDLFKAVTTSTATSTESEE